MILYLVSYTAEPPAKAKRTIGLIGKILTHFDTERPGFLPILCLFFIFSAEPPAKAGRAIDLV